MIRKSLWWILSWIAAVVLFCIILALFPRNKVVQESVNMELTYVFVDEYGNEYDVFAKDGHGSATDWSFLFEEEEWDLDTWSDENIQNTWNIQTTWNNQITQKTWTNSQKTWTNDQNTWWNTKIWNNQDHQSRTWTTNNVNTWNTNKTTSKTNSWNNTTKTWVKIANKTWIQNYLPQEVREIAYQVKIPYTLLQSNSGLITLILNSKAISTTWEKEQRIQSLLTMDDGQIEELQNTLRTENLKLELIEKKYWSWKNDTWNTLQNIDYVWNWTGQTQTWTVKSTWDVKRTYKSCVTPWNYVVQHWEYVLAYQQRTDVPDICNVQKRVCKDGKLWWTYTQWYCNEDVEYKYTKVKVVAHNNKTESQLIQNPKYGKNEAAGYDKYWKINWEWDTPTTIWDNNDTENPLLTQTTTVSQNEKAFYNCTAPWWDIVTHGQFVKAYASPLWFTDDWCKVELRLCLDWELQWNYAYQKCKYTNISYSEYRDGDKTIYDLYNEAYNLTTQETVTESTQQIYDELSQIYDDAENVHGADSSTWATWESLETGLQAEVDTWINDLLDDNENTTPDSLYIKKTFFQQVRDWLVSLF